MGMTIIHCDRCKHWTVGLFGVPNAKTGVADKHCKSCLPKECPDTVPEDLKGEYDQYYQDVQAGKYDPEPVPVEDDDDDVGF